MIIAKTELDVIPKDCVLCRFLKSESDFFDIDKIYHLCLINDKSIVDAWHKPDWCPLIEIDGGSEMIVCKI